MHAPWSFVPLKDDEVSCTPREDKFGAMVEEIDYIDTWIEMEKCVELGLCKNLAVSNFSSKQIDRLLEKCKIKPVINQVECHAYFNNQALFPKLQRQNHFNTCCWNGLQKLNEYCGGKGIKLMAFHPIGETRVKNDDIALRDDPKLAEIAKQYGKTPVQVTWFKRSSRHSKYGIAECQSILGTAEICYWEGYCTDTKVSSSWTTQRKFRRLRLQTVRWV